MTTLTVDRKTLMQALTRVGSALPSRPLAARTIRLEAFNDLLALEADSKSQNISTGIPVTGGRSATITVNSDPLLSLLKACPNTTVEVAFDAEDQLRLGTGQVNLLLAAAKTGPRMADVDGRHLPLSPHIMAALRRASAASAVAGMDERRRSVCLDRCAIYGTDNYRLAVTHGLRPLPSVTLPTAILKPFLAHAGSHGDLVVGARRAMLVAADGTTVNFPLPAHNPIQWNRLVPKRHAGHVITFSRAAALKALTRLRRAPWVDLTQAVERSVHEPLRLSTPDAQETIPVRAGCLPGPVRFDLPNLKAALESLSQPWVRAHIVVPGPTRFTEGAFTHLLMPLKV